MNRTFMRRGALAVTVLALAGLMPTGAPSALAAQPPPELAAATVFAGGVDFWPNVSYRRAVVTVSGGDQEFTLTFEPGEDIFIGSFDPEGNPLADGLYTWRLELEPDVHAAQQLRIAASANGGEAPDAWRPLSGAFTVGYGSIVSPDAAEPQHGPVVPPFEQSGLPISHGLHAPASRGVMSSDSDLAVERGAEERPAAAATEERRVVSGVGTAFGQILSEDSDATAASVGETLERLINESTGLSSRASVTRPVKPADGSNGRKPGSTPSK